MLAPPLAPASKSADNDMSAVFAQLNQGEAITAGLRKVDKSKMTHKNPELRASGMVTSSPSKDSYLYILFFALYLSLSVIFISRTTKPNRVGV